MSASFGEWGSSFSSRIVRSPLTGDVAWLLFEYCITLDQEVDLFWGQKITGASVLYLSNRYLPLFCSLWWVPWWRQSLSFNVSYSRGGRELIPVDAVSLALGVCLSSNGRAHALTLLGVSFRRSLAASWSMRYISLLPVCAALSAFCRPVPSVS